MSGTPQFINVLGDRAIGAGVAIVIEGAPFFTINGMPITYLTAKCISVTPPFIDIISDVKQTFFTIQVGSTPQPICCVTSTTMLGKTFQASSNTVMMIEAQS